MLLKNTFYYINVSCIFHLMTIIFWGVSKICEWSSQENITHHNNTVAVSPSTARPAVALRRYVPTNVPPLPPCLPGVAYTRKWRRGKPVFTIVNKIFYKILNHTKIDCSKIIKISDHKASVHGFIWVLGVNYFSYSHYLP